MSNFRRPGSTDMGPIPVDADIVHGLGRRLSSVTSYQPPSQRFANRSVELEEFAEITSYSWLNDSVHSVAVPGMPPIYRAPPLNTPVVTDRSRKLPSERSYSWSMDPLIAVVRHVRPEVLQSVDIITSRKCLTMLARWLRKPAWRFRIDVERCGNALLFRDVEVYDPDSPAKIGKVGSAVEHATTKEVPGYDRDLPHYRVVKFALGGVRLLVRFDADACSLDLDSLSDLQNVADAPSCTAVISTSNGRSEELRIVDHGKNVANNDLVEIKSEHEGGHYSAWWRISDQLFLSRVSKLRMCVYRYTESDDSGDTLTVTNVRSMDDALYHGPIAEDIREHQQSYSELPHLLQTIKRLFVAYEGVIQAGGGISVASTSTGLAIFERPTNSNLSAKPREWSQKREPCKYYASARGCRRGASCWFSHEGAGYQALCRFFIQGRCRDGDDCRFSHGLRV